MLSYHGAPGISVIGRTIDTGMSFLPGLIARIADIALPPAQSYRLIRGRNDFCPVFRFASRKLPARKEGKIWLSLVNSQNIFYKSI
jgi:hypothetical protein